MSTSSASRTGWNMESRSAAQMQVRVSQHSWIQIILFHLLPGLCITSAFVAVAAVMSGKGWPASLALLATWLVVGIPLELGILLYQGWRQNGRVSLNSVNDYRKPLSFRDYAWLVPTLLVWTAVISTLLVPLSDALHKALFAWWPGWLVLSTFVQNLGRYSPLAVWSVVVLSLVLNIAIPTIEELYFRSFLLPRMARLGRWAPLVSAVLFSLYHFWLPWEFPLRVVALLPVVYAVQWKRNVYLSIVVHCLLNTIGSLGLLVIVLGG
jgi:CAAX protease family protein